MFKSALTVLAVAGTFAQAPPPVATVDGQAIERATFDHWIGIAARSTGQANAAVPDPETGYRNCMAAKRKAAPGKVTDTRLRKQCEDEYGQLRDQVMQLLISFKWIEGEAVARQISVTDAEVAKSFREQKRQSFPQEADFEKFLRTSGQTLEDILARVRLDLLSNALRDQVVKQHPPVTEADLRRHYAENQSLYALPERRALRLVIAPRAAEARQVRAALERGETWKAVARRQGTRRGGQVGAVDRDTLERRLGTAVFRARRDRLTGPVRVSGGYAVFRVSRIVPARQRPFAEVRKLIRQTLESEAEQTAITTFVQDFTARWRAKTECAAGFVTTDCRNGPAPTGPTWN